MIVEGWKLKESNNLLKQFFGWTGLFGRPAEEDPRVAREKLLDRIGPIEFEALARHSDDLSERKAIYEILVSKYRDWEHGECWGFLADTCIELKNYERALECIVIWDREFSEYPTYLTCDAMRILFISLLGLERYDEAIEAFQRYFDSDVFEPDLSDFSWIEEHLPEAHPLRQEVIDRLKARYPQFTEQWEKLR